MTSPALPTADAPLLLTPGPLTTARATREAMLQDFGSRDGPFIALTRSVRERLLALAGATASHACVLLQGSGTFAVEAMLGTLVAHTGNRVLALVNGAYGRRMVEILDRLGRPCLVHETDETVPPLPEEIDWLLATQPDLTHVAMVHCETTTGLRNPVEAIPQVVARHHRALLLDSMSAFGALPIDARSMPFTALAASANKCLEGVPGLAFVLCERTVLEKTAGQAHALSLDLHAQWTAMERDGQWRFTPPTQVVAALATALDLFEAAGGQPARFARYTENCRVLRDGMQRLGFVPLLPDEQQAPIIVTFHMPPAFRFDDFYARMRERGYVLYPGKLARKPSLRIGCIGAITPDDLAAMVTTAADILRKMT
ncbi:MAG: 2-aminoethylphosphonate--pyruvate transaminase [Rhodospirillaceae bacterium]|nr:MAG: 2-aminoethylphosphonate--pyruvate transaminase [Rhodospirillaceae bacterium]